MRYRINIIRLASMAAAAALLCAALISCEKENPVQVDDSGGNRVLLYYAAGFNNLSSYLSEDIGEMCNKGFVPSDRSDAVFLIFSNLTTRYGAYSTPSRPTLTRIYRNRLNDVVKDTLLTLEEGTLAASVNTLNEVLSYVKENYPGKEYGMIFSSHATGWLPAENKEEAESPSANPLSIGNEYKPDTGTKVSYEMDLPDFANAIPMKLDFILFDACFMGGVEVAYELKDKCRKVAFSQAEVLADGFDYTIMAEYLLKGKDADLYNVCRQYYEHYNSLSGQYQSATVSLIDCSYIEGLAGICKTIFDGHRAYLPSIRPDDIQCFGRYSEHKYFYDLEDLLLHLGATEEEKSGFREAMEDCLIYKAHTENFMLPGNGFMIESFCGLSSYVPNKGKYDEFYKNLAWNMATGMIE